MSERVEQGFVGRRVGDAEIVHRLDQSAAQVVLHDAVHDRAREPGIAGRGHPRSQLFADVLVRAFGLARAIQILRLDGLLGLGVEDLAFGFEQDLAFVVLVSVLDSHAPEERGEAPEIVLGPFLPRMVVASGALQPHAEKDLADVGGDILRLGKLRYVIKIRRGLEKQVPEAVSSSVANSL